MPNDIPNTTITKPPTPTSSYPYNLGNFSRKIDTPSQECQTWFNKGLTWSYAFNHEEAVRCFEKALEHDQSCAMVHWGIAYASGPNYNKAWEHFDPNDLRQSLLRCHQAVSRAKEVAKPGVGSALIEAIGTRFPVERAENEKDDWMKYHLAYAQAMERVYNDYGDDVDVAALYADALMNIAPWGLWDLATGLPNPKSRTLEIKAVLEKSLTENPASLVHPGILHFNIHLMELSPTPELAIPSGDRLRGLIPDAGHLNHMPGHLDLLIGDYRRAIASNLEAIIGDEKYLKEAGGVNFYAFYRLHNYTFPIYAAMFNGQYRVAMQTVERMELSITEKLMRHPSPPLVDWMEGFKHFRIHILVRFGKWDEILALPFDEDVEFYALSVAVQHYARGIASSVLGDVEKADEELTKFRSMRAKIPPTRHAMPNSWKDILDVAESMLCGEVEYRRGKVEEAFEYLRQAIKRCDNLVYAEPWGWMQPPRHAYAALLLEQGRTLEAAQIYAEDLGYDHSLPRAVRHPNNVWALHGYHECLVKLGRDAEARIVEPQLTLALAVADISIEASCFCRRSAPAADETMACCA